MTYPHTPGWRKSSIGETARDAAKRMETRAPNLRQQVLAIITADGPQTPEQVFATLVARGVKTVLTSVRPRLSELARMGLVEDSGLRGIAEGGQQAIMWRLKKAPAADSEAAQ